MGVGGTFTTVPRSGEVFGRVWEEEAAVSACPCVSGCRRGGLFGSLASVPSTLPSTSSSEHSSGQTAGPHAWGQRQSQSQWGLAREAAARHTNPKANSRGKSGVWLLPPERSKAEPWEPQLSCTGPLSKTSSRKIFSGQTSSYTTAAHKQFRQTGTLTTGKAEKCKMPPSVPTHKTGEPQRVHR